MQQNPQFIEQQRHYKIGDHRQNAALNHAPSAGFTDARGATRGHQARAAGDQAHDAAKYQRFTQTNKGIPRVHEIFRLVPIRAAINAPNVDH